MRGVPHVQEYIPVYIHTYISKSSVFLFLPFPARKRIAVKSMVATKIVHL